MFHRRTFIILIFLILFTIVIWTGYLKIKAIIEKKQTDGIKQLCQYAQLSIYNIENALLSAFDPLSSVGDVIVNVMNNPVLLFSKEDLVIRKMDTLNVLGGFTCDSVLYLTNSTSVWDNIYLTSNDRSTPFRIYSQDDYHKYFVVGSVGSPACSNLWADISAIHITDFNIINFASTLSIVNGNQSCDQIDESTIKISWNFRIRTTPQITTKMDCLVLVRSGYCGQDLLTGKCLHDRKYSPCPNEKHTLDSGNMYCDVDIQSSFYMDIGLEFQVRVNLLKRELSLLNMMVFLNSWALENKPNFKVYHSGLKTISHFVSINNLMDTTIIQNAIEENVQKTLGMSLNTLFMNANENLKDQVITTSF